MICIVQRSVGIRTLSTARISNRTNHDAWWSKTSTYELNPVGFWMSI